MNCGEPMDGPGACARIASLMKNLSARAFNEPISLFSSASSYHSRSLARPQQMRRATDTLSLGSIARTYRGMSSQVGNQWQRSIGCNRSPVRTLPYSRLRLHDGSALVVRPWRTFVVIKATANTCLRINWPGISTIWASRGQPQHSRKWDIGAWC